MTINKDSKYIKNTQERVFYGASVAFILATIIMPPYFGIPVPGFDMTAVRIMIVFIMLMILTDRDRLYDFIVSIKYNKFFLATLPYLFVISYTMVYRVDVKAFLNPFIDLYTLFMLMYVIDKALGVDKTLDLIIGSYYFLAIQGIAEYINGESFFKYLRTLDGALVGGNFIRSGQYRIMGPASHSISYGILLTLGIPLLMLDTKTKKMYMFRRPVLLILMITNIVFTGSRSALAVLGVELIVVFILSEKEDMKKSLVLGILFVLMFAIMIVGTSGTSVSNYFMLQITSVIDELFGTSYSTNYGLSSITKQSSEYRDVLWDIFKIKWLNPLIGIGRKRGFSSEINGIVVMSIDNYYIAEYIRYAYPGMFSYLLYSFYVMIKMVIRIFRFKDGYSKAFFISFLGYAISLLYVDSLGTLKYAYLVVAMFLCYAKEDFVFVSRQKKSKYLRQAI